MLSAVRDIAIVLLAIESLVIGVLLAVLLVQIRKLIHMLQDEISPILNTTNDTANRVQGTVKIVSDTLVTPLIKFSSYAAGFRRAANDIFYVGRRIRPRRPGPGPRQGPTGTS